MINAMTTGDIDLAAAVSETIDHFGVAALNDPQRFRGMLLDMCGVSLSSRAQRERARALCITLERLAARGLISDPARLATEARDVTDDLVRASALKADDAAWAIQTWYAVTSRREAPGPVYPDPHRTLPSPLDATRVAQPDPARTTSSLRGSLTALAALAAVIGLAVFPLRSGATSFLMSNASSELTRGEFRAADRDAEFALELDGSLAPAWTIRGRAALGLQNWSSARAAFTHAIALGAAPGPAWSGIGVATERAGDRGGALTAYRHAIAADKANAEAWGGACRILASQAHDEKAEGAAMTPCEQRLQLVPRDAEAARYLCAFDSDLRRWHPAIGDCGVVVNLNAADLMIYNRRGTAYYDIARYDRAVADFQTATRLSGAPTEVRMAWFGLTLSSQEAKRYSIAIVAGNHAATLYTSPIILRRIYLALAYSYYYENNRAAALAAYHKYKYYKAASG